MDSMLASAGARRAADWADPNFFSDRFGRSTNFWRLLWFLVLPPDTQRTMPTVAGSLLAVVALGIGLAAYNNANNVLFVALSLLLSSLVLSGLLAWSNFRGMRWRLVLPARCRAGEPAPLRLELHNTKRLVPTYSLLFRARLESARDDVRLLHLAERLDPGERTALDWIIQPRRRGVEGVEIAGVESQYPFGFLRKVAGGTLRDEVLVWPARVPYEFRPPPARRTRNAGEAQRRPGQGADLLGLRPYQPGDAPRLMHWKASARLRELVVRVTGEEQHPGFSLLVEMPRSLWSDDGQVERLCGFAASLAEDLFTAGRLRYAAVGAAPPLPVRRLADLHAFFDQLARATPAQRTAPPTLTVGDLLTFKPGPRGQVHVYLNGQPAGAA